MSDGRKRFNRRALLVGGAAIYGASLVAKTGRAAEPTKDAPLTLTAKPGTAQILKDQTTDIWGYSGTVPGPVIRVRQGDDLHLRFRNEIEHASTIHWHGIRIENAMDGVPGLTQKPVANGDGFTYRFTCPDAGTYWYHPHKMSSEQIARGLYGALIVEERVPLEVDQDHALLFDDWRLTEDGQIHEASFGAMHDRAHAGRYGNTFSLNGTTDHVLPVRSGDRLRLRFVNVANANVFAVRIADHALTQIAVDGQPIPPTPATDGLVLLGPGQRTDVIVDAMGQPGTSAEIQLLTRRTVETVGQLAYTDETPRRTARSRAPIVLPKNALPETLDLENAIDIDIPMEGGAMGRMSGAMVDGAWMGMREMVRKKRYAWALSGKAGMSMTPHFTVKRGQTVRLTFRNKTMWPHAMHVHGHHFKEVGATASEPWYRDTIMLFRGQTKTVAFVADNPGKWMLHCHMLEHHEAGMGTWFEVTA